MTYGIIGTNFISDRFAEALLRTSDRAVAVYSRTQQKGKEFAARHQIPTVYTDLDAFFRHPFDAVYIASPNFLHFKQSQMALEYGKHVLMEKPACPSQEEWKKLKQKACEKGLAVMEAMRPVHAAAWQTIAKELPRLGQLRTVFLDFCQYSSRYDAFRAGEVKNAFDPSLSNAALLDIGIYPLAVCCMLFGRPQQLQSRSVMLKGGFEGSGSVLLSYPEFTVTVHYAKTVSSVCPSFFLGEDGGMTVDKVSEPRCALLHGKNKEEEALCLPPLHGPDNMHEEILFFDRAMKNTRLLERAWGITALTLEVLDEIRRQNGIVFPLDKK